MHIITLNDREVYLVSGGTAPLAEIGSLIGTFAGAGIASFYGLTIVTTYLLNNAQVIRKASKLPANQASSYEAKFPSIAVMPLLLSSGTVALGSVIGSIVGSAIGSMLTSYFLNERTA